MSVNLPKLVHLDLKGGVLKLPYILQLLPLMKQCGATGLLMEYENVFPYSDQLSVLTTSCAYTIQEIQELRSACQQLSLDIIPLIQTFGHAEFILRREEFRHLREHSDHPNTFCPSHSDSLPFIEAMLTQVLNAHPDISCFHIGCDEVAPIGVCPKCSDKMQQLSIEREDLYMDHVCRVARILKQRQPSMRVIIWDDMIRRVSPGRLQSSDICGLVEPMVWYYGVESVPDVFDTYSKLFERIWCASAFKGASGCAETLPNINLHIGNTKLWLSVSQDLASKGATLAGIALTGWSRYDHFGILCELLPAAIPSLVVCLAILGSNEGWTEQTHLDASSLLGTSECMSVDWHPRPKPIITNLRFPGNAVFVGSQCQANLYRKFIHFVNSDLYRGWMNKHNMRRGFVNIATILEMSLQAKAILQEFTELKQVLSPGMREIFPLAVVEEWFGQHIDVFIQKLEKVIDQVGKLVK